MSRCLVLFLLLLPVESAMAGELGGSRASMLRQHEIAADQDFTFLRTAKQVREFAQKERLVEVASGADFRMEKVSFPYTRPFVLLFIERLAAQFRQVTGNQLVVTSLTRPTSLQPRNASRLSVHPAGMAVDFRIPPSTAERKWLEEALLSLENRGVLDVTRERSPAHYHVAVFPEQYEQYVTPLIAREAAMAAENAIRAASAAAASAIAAVTAAPDRPLPQPGLFAVFAAAWLAAIGAAFSLSQRRKRVQAD